MAKKHHLSEFGQRIYDEVVPAVSSTADESQAHERACEALASIELESPYSEWADPVYTSALGTALTMPGMAVMAATTQATRYDLPQAQIDRRVNFIEACIAKFDRTLFERNVQNILGRGLT